MDRVRDVKSNCEVRIRSVQVVRVGMRKRIRASKRWASMRHGVQTDEKMSRAAYESLDGPLVKVSRASWARFGETTRERERREREERERGERESLVEVQKKV